MRKLIAVLVLTLACTVATFAQDLPNLNDFKVIGVNNGTAYAVRNVRGRDQITFDLLAAAAEQTEEHLSLDPNNYSVFTMTAGCKDLSYQVLAEVGRLGGNPVGSKKPGARTISSPKTSIRKILTMLCTSPGLTT